MSLVTFPRWPGDRRGARPQPATRLGADMQLEDRCTPATLFSTNATQTDSLPADASVIGTSRDGRYVLFQSTAINVVQNQIDTPGTNDLFWADSATGERRLVSAERFSKGLKAAGAEVTVAGGPANAVLSADGLSVAFVSKTNANKFDGSNFFGTIIDNGNSSDDVFLWSADYARVAAPISEDQSLLMSFEFSVGDTVAIGNSSRATNPAISLDGKVVSFLSPRDASKVELLGATDNGDLTDDLFATRVDSFQVIGKFPFVSVNDPRLVTEFERTTPEVARFAFGKFGSVSVDPLGRYMSDDGTGYVVVSSISPRDVNPTWSPSAPGTLDAYYLLTAGGAVPQVSLVSSRPGAPGLSSNGQVQNAILAPEAANVVVFASKVGGGANTLVTGYVNNSGGGADLYRRVVTPAGVSAPTQLVSSKFGSLVQGSDGLLDGSVGSFSVTPDGSKVAFTSAATNLTAGVTDTNGAFDVFLWDVATEAAAPISLVPSGTSTGNAASTNPRVSQDGLYVAFESLASNLTPVRDTNAASDVFVRDVAAGTTGVASVSTDFTTTGNGPSTGPVIGGSGNAGAVRFNSVADNLQSTFTVIPGLVQIYTVSTPLPSFGVARVVAVAGGRNGFVGLSTFDAGGNLVNGPPVIAFPGYTGELRTAVGDVTGDGIADIIVGAGTGGGPRVKVIDGASQATVYDFFVFESTFTGGVFVAAGDFTGDGLDDIVIGAGEGGGPRVLILNAANLSVIADVFVFEQTFRGGARVATGDVNGDGIADLIASAAEGGGPRVLVLNGAALPLVVPIADFFAFEPTLRNGAYVSSGDFNGDGRDDIVVGAGPGGAPRVQVFDAALLNNPPSGANPVLLNFFAFGDDRRDGVRVAVAQVDGDNVPDIVVGAGDGAPTIRTFAGGQFAAAGVPQLIQESFAFDDPFGTFGAWVG